MDEVDGVGLGTHRLIREFLEESFGLSRNPFFFAQELRLKKVRVKERSFSWEDFLLNRRVKKNPAGLFDTVL